MRTPTVAVLTAAFVCAATSAAVAGVLNLSAPHVGSGDRANQDSCLTAGFSPTIDAVTADDVTQSTDQIKSIDVSDIPEACAAVGVVLRITVSGANGVALAATNASGFAVNSTSCTFSSGFYSCTVPLTALPSQLPDAAHVTAVHVSVVDAAS